MTHLKNTSTNIPVVSPGSPLRKFSKAKPIAEKLGLCPRTIFRMADAGRITRFKVNERVVLFDESEIAAIIESARVGRSV